MKKDFKAQQKKQILVQTDVSHFLAGRKIFNFSEFLKKLQDLYQGYWLLVVLSLSPFRSFSTFTAVKTSLTTLTKCAMRTSYTLHLSLIYVSLHSVSPSVLLLVIYLPQQRCKNHKDSEFCLLCFLLKPQRLVSYIPGPQQGFRNICLKM